MRKTILCLALVIFMLAFAAVGTASAATIYVSKAAKGKQDGTSWKRAFSTVTAALNVSVAGDEVWVARGTYNEAITLKNGVALYGGFAGTETSLAERDYTANITILDGTGAQSPVVTALTDLFGPTRLDGFTIQNGSGYNNGSTTMGGGIYCENANNPVIANNTIKNNQANDGAGIYCVGGVPYFSNNTITANTAANSGGGVYCVNSSAQFSSNQITGNSATNYGGGIYMYNSPLTITNSAVNSNIALAGGGIYVSYSAPVIQACDIQQNSTTVNSPRLGAGIMCVYSANPRIQYCMIALNHGEGIYFDHASGTVLGNRIFDNDRNHIGIISSFPSLTPAIVSNTMRGYAGYGVFVEGSAAPKITNNTIVETWIGVCCTDSSAPVLTNNILANNKYGAYALIGSASMTVNYNDFFNNVYGDLTGASFGVGNIFADPMLDGAYHLMAGSPCINAGDNSAITDPSWTDADGQARIQGGQVDIGSDELQ